MPMWCGEREREIKLQQSTVQKSNFKCNTQRTLQKKISEQEINKNSETWSTRLKINPLWTPGPVIAGLVPEPNVVKGRIWFNFPILPISDEILPI